MGISALFREPDHSDQFTNKSQLFLLPKRLCILPLIYIYIYIKKLGREPTPIGHFKRDGSLNQLFEPARSRPTHHKVLTKTRSLFGLAAELAGLAAVLADSVHKTTRHRDEGLLSGLVYR